MADEDDWFGGGDDEPAPVIKPLGKKKQDEEDAAAEAEAAAPADGEAPAPEDAALEGEFDEDYLDPDKLLLFKHWIRPKFLPYRYLYLYRRIYYDDVMDYLDKRSRGIPRDIPHAETWAERLIRHSRNKVDFNKIYRKIVRQDLTLVEKTKYSGSYSYYHNKQLFNKRFSPLLH